MALSSNLLSSMMPMTMTEWNRRRRRVPLVGVTGSHEGSTNCIELYSISKSRISLKTTRIHCTVAFRRNAQYFLQSSLLLSKGTFRNCFINWSWSNCKRSHSSSCNNDVMKNLYISWQAGKEGEVSVERGGGWHLVELRQFPQLKLGTASQSHSRLFSLTAKRGGWGLQKRVKCPLFHDNKITHNFTQGRTLSGEGFFVAG